uniref:Dihydropyrimidinase-related protein 5 n=1 Tax=Anas zonorhyncha TaxID=75864 RepID=A0A8B9V372_9AVES
MGGHGGTRGDTGTHVGTCGDTGGHGETHGDTGGHRHMWGHMGIHTGTRAHVGTCGDTGGHVGTRMGARGDTGTRGSLWVCTQSCGATGAHARTRVCTDTRTCAQGHVWLGTHTHTHTHARGHTRAGGAGPWVRAHRDTWGRGHVRVHRQECKHTEPRGRTGCGDVRTRVPTGTWVRSVGAQAGLTPSPPLHTHPAPPQPGPTAVPVPAGKVVYAETTTAHATLTGLHYYHQDWFHAAAYVTVPPLRLDTNTSAYLMSLLANDTLNVVASDHRPFSTKQKAMGKEDFTKIPHGVSGVQDRMNIIWERGVVGGKMDENRFVAVTSSNAAKLHNLYPRKGRIIPGADADVVVWDPEATKTISASTQVQGGEINLYENMRCHGVPLVTISRGRVVYENGVFMCAEGTGKFCPLRSFPDSVYKKLVQREKVRRSMTTFQSELRPGFSLPPEAGRAAFGKAGDLAPN